jgi:hypothetical protein
MFKIFNYFTYKKEPIIIKELYPKKIIDYDGAKIDNLKQGKGELTIYNLISENEKKFIEKYKGDFYNDMKHGYGELKEKDSFYKGNFKEDKKCGFANQQIKNTNYEEDYTGDFYNNLRHGQGKLMTKIIDDKSNINYEIYIGQFVSNMKHGSGQLVREDKIIKGLWIENKFIHEE